MTIAGQTLTVTQNGAACSFSVTPTSVNAPAAGSTGTFAVVTTSALHLVGDRDPDRG